jgi:hypothetical protein
MGAREKRERKKGPARSIIWALSSTVRGGQLKINALISVLIR